MKKILLFCTTILFIGCDLLPKNLSIGSTSSNTPDNVVEFRDKTIVFANEYIETSAEEFEKRLNSLDDNSKFKKIALQELQKIKSKNVDFQLVVDKANVENYVFVYYHDFIQFDEIVAARHVANLSSQLKDEASIQEVRYKRIHGRFFYTHISKIVKLKYLKAYKDERKFQTEYIVASKSGGMGVLVSNTENVDFEKSIKSIALK